MASRVIGLTGPTGAGKSTWSAAFRALGCPVIDCDRLARKAAEKPEVLQRLQQLYGADVVRAGTLDRRLLANRAFGSRQSVQQLNAVMHPVILRDVAKTLQAFRQQHAPLIIIDAPQLFEGGAQVFCDAVAVVMAPKAVRLRRILQRDGITGEEAEKRMASQYSEDFFRAHADWILDGTLQPEQVPDHARMQLQKWLGERV